MQRKKLILFSYFNIPQLEFHIRNMQLLLNETDHEISHLSFAIDLRQGAPPCKRKDSSVAQNNQDQENLISYQKNVLSEILHIPAFLCSPHGSTGDLFALSCMLKHNFRREQPVSSQFKYPSLFTRRQCSPQ